jgi:predicted RNase H-like nuclease (RuvC/YqgF family)
MKTMSEVTRSSYDGVLAGIDRLKKQLAGLANASETIRAADARIVELKEQVRKLSTENRSLTARLRTEAAELQARNDRQLVTIGDKFKESAELRKTINDLHSQVAGLKAAIAGQAALADGKALLHSAAENLLPGDHFELDITPARD